MFAPLPPGHLIAPMERTPWTVLGELANGNSAARERAMDTLTRAYWPCVYAYLRRCGYGSEAAEETTQGFFAEVVIGRGLFDTADPARGRMRSLLLSSVRNYERDCGRRTATRRRAASGFDAVIHREERLLGSAPVVAAEEEFERRLKLWQVEEAMRRCEEHYRAAGKEGHWMLFVERVVQPARGFVPADPLEVAALRWGFSSAAAGAAAVQVVKERLKVVARIVRDELHEPEGGGAELSE